MVHMTGSINLTDADLRAMIADYFASKMIRVDPAKIVFSTVYKPAYAYGSNQGEEMTACVSIDTEPSASETPRD